MGYQGGRVRGQMQRRQSVKTPPEKWASIEKGECRVGLACLRLVNKVLFLQGAHFFCGLQKNKRIL